MKDKARLAVGFILSHCPHIGRFQGTGEPYLFLQQTAARMSKSAPTPTFPARYIEHVAYAVHQVGSNTFLTPPAAVAAVYLATRFEFYFRLLSGQLNGDGTWVSQTAQQAALASIGDQRLSKPRVSSVSLAYKVMKLGSSGLTPYCDSLDRALYPSPTIAGDDFTVGDVGARIEYGRHRVAHGSWGDISAEAAFYGLMTAMVFYSQ